MKAFEVYDEVWRCFGEDDFFGCVAGRVTVWTAPFLALFEPFFFAVGGKAVFQRDFATGATGYFDREIIPRFVRGASAVAGETA